MASTFETIVRPFQTPVAGTPVAEANQVGQPNVIISAGRSGRGRQFQGKFTRTVTFYMTRRVNETKNS